MDFQSAAHSGISQDEAIELQNDRKDLDELFNSLIDENPNAEIEDTDYDDEF